MSDRLKKIFYFLSATGTLVGTLAVSRSYLSGEKYEGKEEMYGKTVVITGANRGLGKETARELAKRGARVILACKDMQMCSKVKEELKSTTFNKNIECMECDLASLKSIREFADRVKKEEKFLHVLVNNAAVMWCPKTFTKEGFETHLGVNHMGHFYLTNLLLPKLIECKPSRILVITCREYLKAKKINFNDLNSSKKYNIEEAYNQSKLANLLFGLELSDRLQDQNINITVNCVDPGYVFSDLMRYSSIYTSSFSPMRYFFKTFLKTPEMGAQSVVYGCVSDELEKVTGKYIR
jgi:retinol dehydrogenase-13